MRTTWQAWGERRALGAPVRDLALAGVLATFGLLDVLLSSDWRGPAAVNAVVVPVMALALAWRRDRPLLTLGVAVSGVSFLSLAFGGSQTWSNVFILLVAVYSAAAYSTHLWAAAALGAVGTAIRDLRDPLIDGFGDAIWGSSIFVLCFLAGLAGRSLHARTSALDQRAETLDREEEERAAAAAAEERKRIARELHDIISHSIGVVVLQAGAAEQVLERDPERAREVLRSIRATGQEAIAEMGTLLGLIRGAPRTSHEPQPSLADVEGLLDRTRAAGLETTLKIEGTRRALPAALELSAFRIVQEGLTNALKHAGPARARVTLRFGEHELQVEVVDDGAGSGNGRGGRRGLAGIGERVAVFGGDLEAGPLPGGGWRLRADLPFPR